MNKKPARWRVGVAVLWLKNSAADMEIWNMASRLQETNRFEAIGRSGQKYTIIESTSQTSLDPMTDSESRWANGSSYFRALDFGPVSQISDSEFVIFLSGEKVKKL